MIVTDYIEMKPGLQQKIKYIVRGEMKNHGKNCVSTREERTMGAIDIMPDRNIIACVINPTDEKLTLKPDTVISILQFFSKKKGTKDGDIICNVQGGED